LNFSKILILVGDGSLKVKRNNSLCGLDLNHEIKFDRH
jgi:hypothetical protein